MTSEVQTTLTTQPTTSGTTSTKLQRKPPFQSSFSGQIMRSSRKTSSQSGQFSAPVIADGRMASQLQLQLKSARRDAPDSNSSGDSPILQTTQQDNDDGIHDFHHLNKEGLNPSEEETDKHHVGPVMGIFFKVWSLVKVTKVRNQHKMRRQNSEDTSQFQYISGSQLAQSSQQQQQQRHSAGGLLEDRHFRRAGSQPAPSSSSRQSEHFALANRYQQSQSAGGQLVACTGGNNSTSSGVSSGASSCHANEQPVASFGGQNQLRAYSLRHPNSQSPAIDRQSNTSRQVEAVRTGKTSFSAKPSGWAAKIKRSATSVNQADVASYASRYRFRRSNQQATFRAGSRGPKLASGSKSEERTLERDEDAGVDDYAIAAAMTRTTSSNKLVSQEREDYDGEEDEDSNDIYSTPNDSIQSVPGSVPLMANELMMPRALAVHQAASQAYPIIKSFSTTNFQLLKQQQQSSNTEPNYHFQNQAKFKCIDERSAGNTNTSVDKRNDGEQFQRQDSSQSNSTSKRLNGSRFFISSSSSEDSNHSPANHQNLLAANHQQPDQQVQNEKQLISLRPVVDRQQSIAQQLEQKRPQVPLQLGVHYHAPPNPYRPDSLLLGSSVDGRMVNLMMPVSLFTPINGVPTPLAHVYQQTPATSAMSPSHPPSYLSSIGYRKSPSLMEIAHRPRLASSAGVSQRFTAKFPSTRLINNSTFKPTQEQHNEVSDKNFTQNMAPLPNSISLYDCKLSSHRQPTTVGQINEAQTVDEASKQQQEDEVKSVNGQEDKEEVDSEYRLAKMLLEFGSNPKIKDQYGCTALMHAVLSDNIPVMKCLIENGADLNETNQAGLSALDLICLRAPTTGRLEMLKFLIDKHTNMDQCSERDGTRLLDRLIGQHQPNNDKLPFIECLLQNGARLGSSTWLAASGKYEIQLRLLKKLCQDGYFLYKTSSVAAAVYRFEYALKRISELEQQLSSGACHHATDMILLASPKQSISSSVRQIKYQTYLGLSRCERKRRFYKRALEFAHMAILVDSTSYEGFYSKAHILKDLGEIDDSLMVIDQTSRLIDKSMENLNKELETLNQQEEALIFDGCFDLLDKRKPSWFDKARSELSGNLDYLEEAKKFVSRLRVEIMDDKLKVQSNEELDDQKAIFPTSAPIATCN